MPQKFNIIAQLQIQGPAPGNVRAALAQANSQLKGISTNLNVNIPPQTQRNLNQTKQQLQSVGKQAVKSSGDIEAFGRSAAESVKRASTFSAVTALFFTLGHAIKAGLRSAIDFEHEMNRIRQVTGATATTLGSLSKEITRLSTGLGVSSKELVLASRTLAQAGLSAKDVTIALEALAKADLSPTFDSITKTTEGAVAIFRQFETGAEDLEEALGKINIVASKFAVESRDIISAVQKTGGAFAAAGGELDELIALFTSVRATTRESAESIATGFRTIFTRLQRTRTIDFLEKLGIKGIRDEVTKEFAGPFEAVRILSKSLQGISSRSPIFSQIIEELGGFRQVSKVIPLIQQFETATKAYATAQAGANSLSKDAAVAQESIAVQLKKTREEFAALTRKIAQNDAFQKFLKLTLSLTQGLFKLVGALEPLLPLFGALGALKLGTLTKRFFSRETGFRSKLGFAGGGLVPGRGDRDTVPAMLTPGEFVIRKKAVETIGPGRLQKLNRGGYVQRFGRGDEAFKTKPSFDNAEEIKEFLTTYKGQINERSTAEAIVRAIRSTPGVVEARHKQTQNTAGININLDDADGLEKLILNPRVGETDRQGNLKFVVLKGSAAKAATKPENKPSTYSIGSSDKPLIGGAFLTTDPVGNKTQSAAIGANELTKTKHPEAIAKIEEQLGTSGINKVLVPIQRKLTNTEDAKTIIDTLGEGASSVITQLASNLSGTEVKKRKLESLIDGNARSSIEGHMFEGLIRQFGEQISEVADRARFDFVGDVNSSGVARLTGTFDESVKVVDAKRTATDRASQDIVKKAAGTIVNENLPGHSALLGGIQKLNRGGFAKGGSVPALLTPGEFVVDKQTASRVGTSTLRKLNYADKYAKGGRVLKLRKDSTIGQIYGNIRKTSKGISEIRPAPEPGPQPEFTESETAGRISNLTNTILEGINKRSKYPKGTVSKEVINTVLSQGGFKFAGNVYSHRLQPLDAKMPASAAIRRKFEAAQTTVFDNINASVNQVFSGEPAARGKFNIKDNKNAKDTIEGFLLEGFTVAQAGLKLFEGTGNSTAPFDLILSPKQRKRLDGLVDPYPVIARYVDFKRTRQGGSAILRKAARQGLFNRQASSPLFLSEVEKDIPRVSQALSDIKGIQKNKLGKNRGGLISLALGGRVPISKGDYFNLTPTFALEPSVRDTFIKVGEDDAARKYIPKGSTFLGAGIQAFAVNANPNVIRVGNRLDALSKKYNKGAIKRLNNRNVLQAIDTKEVGGILFEELPKVETLLDREKKLRERGLSKRQARRRIGKAGLAFNNRIQREGLIGLDAHLGNLGFYNKQLVTFDPDAVIPYNESDSDDAARAGFVRSRLQRSAALKTSPKLPATGSPVPSPATASPSKKEIQQLLFGFNSGGFVVPGQGNRDTVPAMLTPGEFVIRKKAVEQIGTDTLQKLNSGGVVKRYAPGGSVGGSNLLAAGAGIGGILFALQGLEGLGEELQKTISVITSAGVQFAAVFALINKSASNYEKAEGERQKKLDNIALDRSKEEKKNLRSIKDINKERADVNKKFTAERATLRRRANDPSQTAAQRQISRLKLNEANKNFRQTSGNLKAEREERAAQIVRLRTLKKQEQNALLEEKTLKDKAAREERNALLIAAGATALIAAGSFIRDNFVTPEIEAGRGTLKTEAGFGSTSTIAAASGGLTTGGLGLAGAAALAPLLGLTGPIGVVVIALGALGGALYGAYTAFRDAEKQIRAIRFEQTLDKFNRRLELVSNGTLKYTDLIIDAESQLRQLRQRSFEVSGAERKEFKTTTDQLVPQFREIANAIASSIDVQAAGGTANATKILQDRAGELISGISRFSGESVGEVTKTLVKRLGEGAAADALKKENQKLLAIQEEQIQALEGLNSGIVAVTQKMVGFSNAIDNIVSLSSGGLGVTNVTSRSEIIGQERIIDFNAFRQAITDTVGGFGSNAGALGEQLITIGQFSKEFRGGISSFVNTGFGGDEDNEAGSILKRFEDFVATSLGEQSGTDIKPGTQQSFILNALKGVFAELSGADSEEANVLDALRSNRQETISKFLDAPAIKQLRDTLANLAKAEEDHLNNLIKVSGQRIEAENNVIANVQKGFDLSGQLEDTLAKIEGRDVDFTKLQQIDDQRVVELTRGRSADELLKQRDIQEAELAKARKAFDTGPIEQRIAADKSIKSLEANLNKTNKGLQLLADAGSRAAVNLQKLDKIQAAQTQKSSVFKDFIFGGTEQRLQFGQGLRASVVAAQDNNLSRIPENLRGSVASFFESLSEVTFPALGNRTGRDIGKDILSGEIQRLVRAGGGQITKREADELALKSLTPEAEKIRDAIKDTFADSKKILDEEIKRGNDAIQNIGKVLEIQNENFLKGLERARLQGNLDLQEAEVKAVGGDVANLTKQQETFAELQKLGVKPDDVTKINNNLDGLKKFKELSDVDILITPFLKLIDELAPNIGRNLKGAGSIFSTLTSQEFEKDTNIVLNNNKTLKTVFDKLKPVITSFGRSSTFGGGNAVNLGGNRQQLLDRAIQDILQGTEFADFSSSISDRVSSIIAESGKKDIFGTSVLQEADINAIVLRAIAEVFREQQQAVKTETTALKQAFVESDLPNFKKLLPVLGELSPLIKEVAAVDFQKVSDELPKLNNKLGDLKQVIIDIKAELNNIKPDKDIPDFTKKLPLPGVGNFVGVSKNLGGKIPGYGTKDTIPAMLTKGEYVVNANAVKQGNNLALLEKMNKGVFYANAGGLAAAPKNPKKREEIANRIIATQTNFANLSRTDVEAGLSAALDLIKRGKTSLEKLKNNKYFASLLGYFNTYKDIREKYNYSLSEINNSRKAEIPKELEKSVELAKTTGTVESAFTKRLPFGRRQEEVKKPIRPVFGGNTIARSTPTFVTALAQEQSSRAAGGSEALVREYNANVAKTVSDYRSKVIALTGQGKGEDSKERKELENYTLGLLKDLEDKQYIEQGIYQDKAAGYAKVLQDLSGIGFPVTTARLDQLAKDYSSQERSNLAKTLKVLSDRNKIKEALKYTDTDNFNFDDPNIKTGRLFASDVSGFIKYLDENKEKYIPYTGGTVDSEILNRGFAPPTFNPEKLNDKLKRLKTPGDEAPRVAQTVLYSRTEEFAKRIEAETTALRNRAKEIAESENTSLSTGYYKARAEQLLERRTKKATQASLAATPTLVNQDLEERAAKIKAKIDAKQTSDTIINQDLILLQRAAQKERVKKLFEASSKVIPFNFENRKNTDAFRLAEQQRASLGQLNPNAKLKERTPEEIQQLSEDTKQARVDRLSRRFNQSDNKNAFLQKLTNKTLLELEERFKNTSTDALALVQEEIFSFDRTTKENQSSKFQQLQEEKRKKYEEKRDNLATTFEEDKKRKQEEFRKRRNFNTGGIVPGQGNTDSVPALLTPGEYVLNKGAVQKIGLDKVQRMNRQGFQTGGPVTNGSMVLSAESIQQMQTFNTAFAANVARLQEATKAIPSSITMSVQHNLNVTFSNALEIFGQLEPKIQELATAVVLTELNRMIADKFPDVGQLGPPVQGGASKPPGGNIV